MPPLITLLIGKLGKWLQNQRSAYIHKGESGSRKLEPDRQALLQNLVNEGK